MRRCLYLIDGSGFIFRAFHALPPLTTPQGEPIGAVVGFGNMILRLQEKKIPTDWAVVFDLAQPTFRHTLFPDYKAHRPPMPKELGPQFGLIRELCQALNMPIIEKPGFEADDLLATYAKVAVHQGWEVEVISSDKDMMQLVQPHIRLYDPLKQRMIDEAAVVEKWGVVPAQVAEVQALVGDKSDNISGIPGVGLKTAVEWIQRFGSLQELLDNYMALESPRKRQLIETYREKAVLCHRLVTLKEDVDMPVPLEDLEYRLPDSEKLETFLSRYSLNALKTRLVRKGILKPTPIVIPQQLERLSQVYAMAEKEGRIALIFEEEAGQIVGIGWSVRAGQGGYTAVTGEEPMLQKLLATSYILKIVHNAKELLKQAEMAPFDDVMILSYLCEGGQKDHALAAIVERTCHAACPETITETAGQRASLLFSAWQILKNKIRTLQCVTVYETLERPLIPVLARMEQRGIQVDVAYLQQLKETLSQQLSALEEEIYALAGHKFNLASPKQMGEVLFQILKWPGGKKGKSGAYQTSVEVLEAFAASGKVLAKKILQWRQLAKLNTTYTDPLIQQVNPQTQRVSTSYSMVTTSTGRLSSLRPNLQNIPVRSPEGKEIRQAFQASDGYVLLSLDYSQIELRLLAHMGDIPNLKEAFRQGRDIHQQTACQLFGCQPEAVTPDMRRQAKTINFGIIYGMSAFGLSQQLGISVPEAQRRITQYFQRFPGIQRYIQQAKEQAKEHGYVRTLWGRRCYIPHILSQNHALRSAAERQAINAPLQGSSADIMKRGMIHVAQWIAQNEAPADLLLQVHDEVILEVREDYVAKAIPPLTRLLRHVVHLSVPLEVNASYGKRWS